MQTAMWQSDLCTQFLWVQGFFLKHSCVFFFLKGQVFLKKSGAEDCVLGVITGVSYIHQWPRPSLMHTLADIPTIHVVLSSIPYCHWKFIPFSREVSRLHTTPTSFLFFLPCHGFKIRCFYRKCSVSRWKSHEWGAYRQRRGHLRQLGLSRTIFENQDWRWDKICSSTIFDLF